MTDDRTVAVLAVLTYRRTHLLRPLLTALVQQAAALSPPALVVVVDNDPDGGARAAVQEWAAAGVRYESEPRPGIAAARNRALDAAADADVLVFIDDDELPTTGWLPTLVAAWREWRCAAVTGPVRSEFAAAPSAWVAGSGVFTRTSRPSGTLLGGGATNNLLLDVSAVRALGLRFDERFGLTGGEDTMFVHQLVAGGGEIRWCDEAEVVEVVPVDRTTRDWVLRRCFRSGSSWSRAEVLLAVGPVRRWRLRLVLTAKAAVRVPAAAAAVLWHLARADAGASARAACTAASNAGLLVGAYGHVPAEYARPLTGATA